MIEYKNSERETGMFHSPLLKPPPGCRNIYTFYDFGTLTESASPENKCYIGLFFEHSS